MGRQKVKRNQEIMKLRFEGWELQEIAVKLGISKQRVHQIIQQAQKDRKELRRLKKKTL